jgi:PAS domain S-box-containing protein
MEPANEQKRIAALYDLGLDNTLKDSRIDRITRLTAQIFAVPMCGVSLVDKREVLFKSLQGLQLKRELRDTSFSNLVVESGEILVVEDTLKEPQCTNFPLVTTGPKIRFYVGIPLKTADGFAVGDYFIASSMPRKFTDFEKSVLSDLSAWVLSEITQNSRIAHITQEQRNAQEKLTASNREMEADKARHDAMLESIGDGVIGINDHGEVIFSNKPVELMTRFNQSELIGKPIWFSLKLLDKEENEVDITKRPIRNALYSKKKIATNDYFYVRKDGTKFPVAITATPVVVFDQVIGGVVVFRDITKEKDVDRMKTEFISLASHQLRTPLSAMKWFSEILLDGDAGELSEEQKEMMTNIYQSNERMIDLVNTLLNISRIESGRIIVDPKPTDLKKLVDEVVLELQTKLTKKNHNLAISVYKDLPKVNIDSRLIRHVYMNLLTNAIKYTPENGEIVVMISKLGNDIVSQVSDNGYGIPKNQQEKVFKKFFRAENVVKVETDGTGLGLYLIKSIIDSSGGKIWFKSDEDKGTTFWFSLPLSGSIPKKGEVTIDS